MLASFIGYVIGDILSNPKGKGKAKKQGRAAQAQARQLSVVPAMPNEAAPVIAANLESMPQLEEPVPQAVDDMSADEA